MKHSLVNTLHHVGLGLLTLLFSSAALACFDGNGNIVSCSSSSCNASLSAAGGGQCTGSVAAPEPAPVAAPEPTTAAPAEPDPVPASAFDPPPPVPVEEIFANGPKSPSAGFALKFDPKGEFYRYQYPDSDILDSSLNPGAGGKYPGAQPEDGKAAAFDQFAWATEYSDMLSRLAAEDRQRQQQKIDTAYQVYLAAKYATENFVEAQSRYLAQVSNLEKEAREIMENAKLLVVGGNASAFDPQKLLDQLNEINRRVHETKENDGKYGEALYRIYMEKTAAFNEATRGFSKEERLMLDRYIRSKQENSAPPAVVEEENAATGKLRVQSVRNDVQGIVPLN